LERIKVGLGAVMDKENAKDQPYSGRKIDPILQTVAFLIHAQWSFFAINMHPNNIY
jgi:hypothetical protein